MSTSLRSTVRVVRALADKQRARIVLLLQHGELCVCQITAVLGLATSTVSKHLSILDAAEIVEPRKAGRWMYYRLTESSEPSGPKRLVEWLATSLAGEEIIRSDAARLARVKACDPEELCKQQRKIAKKRRSLCATSPEIQNRLRERTGET